MKFLALESEENLTLLIFIIKNCTILKQDTTYETPCVYLYSSYYI